MSSQNVHLFHKYGKKFGEIVRLVSQFVVVILLLTSYLDGVSAQVNDHETIDTEEAAAYLSGSSNSSELLNSAENTNETSWEDGNWRRKDKSRVAAVVVYSSVILIALFGVLIKYFVTQYETLQAKAQLEYQQLRNVQIN